MFYFSKGCNYVNCLLAYNYDNFWNRNPIPIIPIFKFQRKHSSIAFIFFYGKRMYSRCKWWLINPTYAFDLRCMAVSLDIRSVMSAFRYLVEMFFIWYALELFKPDFSKLSKSIINQFCWKAYMIFVFLRAHRSTQNFHFPCAVRFHEPSSTLKWKSWTIYKFLAWNQQRKTRSEPLFLWIEL